MGDRYRVLWSPSALNDPDEILDYVAERHSASRARALGAKALARADRLETLAVRGRVLPELRAIGVRE